MERLVPNEKDTTAEEALNAIYEAVDTAFENSCMSGEMRDNCELLLEAINGMVRFECSNDECGAIFYVQSRCKVAFCIACTRAMTD